MNIAGRVLLKSILLDLAQERSLEALLNIVVRRLLEDEDVALSRIWLLDAAGSRASLPEGLSAGAPGASLRVCAACASLSDALDTTPSLHLVASAGRPHVNPLEDWTRVTGSFHRIPVGKFKVGEVAATAEPAAVIDVESDPRIRRPEWARAEKIKSFGAQPLVYRGDMLGVLAVFLRATLTPASLDALRVLANHCAAAIVTARAFEDVERLQQKLQLENQYLREELRDEGRFGEIVGESAPIGELLRQIKMVAPTEATVLILGESGTGKELVARAIHKQSRRQAGPLIKVNCAAIPRELYESEFFGHVRGAFSGALKDRVGRFDAASGGTLFLDEVGEIPLELQSKLLRVLQEGTYERIGDTVTRKADVRILAATNRDLGREAASGRFRQDLYYRINVFPIEVVPLRARREDIPRLAQHLLSGICRRMNLPVLRLSDAHLARLSAYDWPGNVRELENVMERAAITGSAGALRLDVPAAPTRDAAPRPSGGRKVDAAEGHTRPRAVPEAEMLRRAWENILAALEESDWRVYGPGGAAEILGIKPTTLLSRMAKLRVSRKRKRPAR
jgi:transcriptional regulator with GAF, ATPase, and Fis domain